ncbi:MAG TPA: ABC transporter permease, partial [Trebonia sp.]
MHGDAVLDVIAGLRELGKTIFLTTHFMDEAEALADRIVVLAAGRIVASGTPQSIGGRSAPGVPGAALRAHRRGRDHVRGHRAGITVVLVLIGWLVFSVHLNGAGAGLVLLSVMVGTACLCGVGYAVSTFVKSQESAGPLVLLIMFVLNAISGIYVPETLFPAWQRDLAQVLPIRPVFLVPEPDLIFRPGYLLPGRPGPSPAPPRYVIFPASYRFAHLKGMFATVACTRRQP